MIEATGSNPFNVFPTLIDANRDGQNELASIISSVNDMTVNVIGGGLAGVEAAWQAAEMGGERAAV